MQSSWIVLVFAGLMETVWAVALGKCDGLSKPLPVVIFVVGLTLSMLGLAYAMRSLPTGVAYSVWVGIGAAGTVIFGMVSGDEPSSPIKIALIACLIACVVGLKLVGDR